MVETARPGSLVSVLIVTFNSSASLAQCFASLQQQDHSPLELVVVDNNSSDSTRTLLAQAPLSGTVILNETNRGFAAAQNQAMREASGEWRLCLNPDVMLAPDFISKLLAADAPASVGALCGKLLRWVPGAEPERSGIIDSTGIYFQPNLRHLDRGAEQPDAGQFQRQEYVFGATGAAALYRRRMVEEVCVEGQFFDEEFFSYREDADLAWRAQLMGWRCLYVPAAVGWHQRRVTPERRESLPHEINWHSVKNRFLMRAKNAGAGLCLHTFIPALVRDVVIFGYALLRDWRMFSALWYPLAHWGGLRGKRKWIQARRRVPDKQLARWFRWQPASEPLEP